MERDRFAFAWHLLLSAALISAVRSQIPLPKHPLGFVYHGGESSAPIHLTAFVDLTCPDSKQAWPTVKKIADMYGPKVVQFTLQLFPLPYHTNAFIAAQVSLRFWLEIPSLSNNNRCCKKYMCRLPTRVCLAAMYMVYFCGWNNSCGDTCVLWGKAQFSPSHFLGNVNCVIPTSIMFLLKAFLEWAIPAVKYCTYRSKDRPGRFYCE